MTTYTAWGVDYAFGNGLTIQELKNNKADFVCRYLSYLPNPKVIDKAEFQGLIEAGIKVVLNWEFTGQEFSKSQGEQDAAEALKQIKALGAPDAAVIFSLDRAAPPDTADPTQYAEGVAQVFPWADRGHYGDDGWMEVVFGQNLAKYGWQTYAWSDNLWHPKAQLQQYQNSVSMGPATVDRDRATQHDYGQYPRPPKFALNPVQALGVKPRYTQADLSWDAAPRATGYRVVVSTHGIVTQSFNVAGLGVTLHNLSERTQYEVTVVATPATNWGLAHPAHVIFNTK